MSEAFSISFIKVNRTLLHKSSEQSSVVSDTGLNSSPRPRIPVSFVVQQQFLTMLCQFLLYSEVNQKLVYLYPLPIGSPSHPSPTPPIQVFTEHRAEFPVNETEVSPFTAKNLMLLHQKGHFLQIQNVTKHVLFTFRNWLIPLSKRQHLFFFFPLFLVAIILHSYSAPLYVESRKMVLLQEVEGKGTTSRAQNWALV